MKITHKTHLGKSHLETQVKITGSHFHPSHFPSSVQRCTAGVGGGHQGHGQALDAAECPAVGGSRPLGRPRWDRDLTAFEVSGLGLCVGCASRAVGLSAAQPGPGEGPHVPHPVLHKACLLRLRGRGCCFSGSIDESTSISGARLCVPTVDTFQSAYA